MSSDPLALGIQAMVVGSRVIQVLGTATCLLLEDGVHGANRQTSPLIGSRELLKQIGR